MKPRGTANKLRRTVHKPRAKEEPSNQFPLSQQGDHNARQGPLNTTSPTASGHQMFAWIVSLLKRKTSKILNVIINHTLLRKTTDLFGY